MSIPLRSLQGLTIALTLGWALASAAQTPPPFDRYAAVIALGAIDVAPCKTAGGPVGRGHVKVTFSPDGSVRAASIDAGPFSGTATAACVAGKFGAARVPPFSGPAVRVGKSFEIY